MANSLKRGWAWLWILALWTGAGLFAAELHETEEGVIDLRGEQVSVLRLSGDWYYAEQPINSRQQFDLTEFSLQPVATGNMMYLSSTTLGPEGAYVLKIRSDRPRSLTFTAGSLLTAAQFLLFRGDDTLRLYSDPIYEHRDWQKTYRQINGFTLTLPLQTGENILVYNYRQWPIEKAEAQYTNAGLAAPVILGETNLVKERMEKQDFFLKVPLGVFACLALYSLLIFLSRGRDDMDSFYLFLFSAVTFLKEFFSQGIIAQWRGGEALPALEAFSFSLPMFGVVVLLWMLRVEVKNTFTKALFWVAALNALATGLHGVLLTSASFLPDTKSMSYLFVVVNTSIFFLFFIPTLLLIAWRQRRLDLSLFTFGVCLLGAGSVADFVKIVNNYDWPWLTSWGGIVLSVILAKNNSRMFAQAFNRATQLNAELSVKNDEIASLNRGLEDKVRERTAEVKALLEYIPQGILSLGDEGIIGTNYSSQLPEILGHSDIAGQSFYDLFLTHTDLSQDDRDQAWQSLLASIGQMSFGFEVNADKLPQELIYTGGEQKKAIKLTWNIELDEDDTVRHVLVTMLDISSEMQAKQELAEKNREFDRIRQLIDIGPAKSVQFFITGRQLLTENQQRLQCEELSAETVKIMFVNMHTLKGAARTLQLKEMASVFHEVEAYYAAILRAGEAIDRARLQSDLAHALDIYHQYEHVNQHILGRDDDDSKVAIGRDFLEDAFQLLANLEVNYDLPLSVKELIHDNCDQLTNIIFDSLPMLLEELLSQSEKIARDLGKEPPQLEVDVDEIFVTHQQEMALKHSFIHLLRNAIDHGIETADERQRLGKPPIGTIKVEAKADDAHVLIRVSDDGRGLAIGVLRSKALERGDIRPEASLTDIAETIFRPGVSTTTKLSQVSGRGIGMDAIRRFIESVGGRVDIELGEPIDAEANFYRFAFSIVLPAKQATKAVGVDSVSRVAG